MKEIHKYLYHYTKFENGFLILKHGNLRLYEARSQNDPFEIIYAGNVIFDFLMDIIENKQKQYDENTIMAILHVLLFISKYYADLNKFERINNIINQMEQDKYFVEFFNIIKKREIKFFITCFSNSMKNEYLWKNYASEGSGLVIKFKSDYLPENIGIKSVHYDNEELIKYTMGVIASYHTILTKDISELMKELTISFTHYCLTTKKEQFKNENEIRLIDNYDSAVQNQNIEFDQNGREFILLPLKKSQFSKRIKAVYYTDRLPKEQANQLIALFNKKNIEIIKLNYSDIEQNYNLM
jgi:hypothetical protein